MQHRRLPELPPALREAIGSLAVAVVDDVAKRSERVRQYRRLFVRNLTSQLEASIRRDLEADAREAFDA